MSNNNNIDLSPSPESSEIAVYTPAAYDNTVPTAGSARQNKSPSYKTSRYKDELPFTADHTVSLGNDCAQEPRMSSKKLRFPRSTWTTGPAAPPHRVSERPILAIEDDGPHREYRWSVCMPLYAYTLGRGCTVNRAFAYTAPVGLQDARDEDALCRIVRAATHIRGREDNRAPRGDVRDSSDIGPLCRWMERRACIQYARTSAGRKHHANSRGRRTDP